MSEEAPRSDFMEDPTRRGKDLQMARFAVRQGWNVSKAMKDKVLKMAEEVIDTSVVARDRIAAAKLAIEADKVDQADEHLRDKNERLDGGKSTESQTITVTYVNKLPEQD